MVIGSSALEVVKEVGVFFLCVWGMSPGFFLISVIRGKARHYEAQWDGHSGLRVLQSLATPGNSLEHI